MEGKKDCMNAHSPFWCQNEFGLSSVTLLDRDIEFAFNLTGQRTGILRDDDRVTSRPNFLAFPRKPASAASPIFCFAGNDLPTNGIHDLYLRINPLITMSVLVKANKTIIPLTGTASNRT